MNRGPVPSEPPGEEEARPRFRHVPGKWLWIGAGAVVAVLVLVYTFVLEPFTVPSDSMEPALRPGDRLIVDKLAYRSHPPRRGDVIVFDGDGAFGGGGDYVKRVVAVAGDHVACCDARGRITVDGRAVDESAYLFPGDKASDEPFDAVVPEGRLWVMGDHRSRSADSRAHLGDPGGGMVPYGDVVGRAEWIAWPLSRIGSAGGR